MGKVKLFIYLFLLLSFSIRASQPIQDSTTTYTFQENWTNEVIFLAPIDIYPDYEGTKVIEEILNDSSTQFSSLDMVQKGKDIRYVWIRINLINASSNPINAILETCSSSDTSWVYDIKNKQIISSIRLIQNESIYSKLLPTYLNYYPFSLAPSETKTFYIRSHFLENTQPFHFNHITLRPADSTISSLFRKNTTQSVYTGMMFLLALISFFLFITFKERSFIYFGLLTFCYILYFLAINAILYNYIPFSLGQKYSLIHIFISGIVLFTGAFVSDFLDLKERLPKIYLIYTVLYIIVASSFHIVINFNLLSYNQMNFIQNLLLLVFILFTIVPVIILTRRKIKAGRILLYSLTILFVAAIIFQLSLLGVIPQSDWTRNSFQFGSLAFSSFLFYGLFDKISGMQSDRIRIKAEKDKTDELLFNILPEEVARELKENGSSRARNFEMASIIFTDFKEFTQISAQLSPEVLVKEINVCFEAFDVICEKHSIEKIKTIGDAYMAVGGLPVPSESSVSNTIKAALELQDFIIARKVENESKGKLGFQMRVGVHTGPIVAGIVGVKKFQYDVWGDTVNTAARLESTGEVNKVNISQITYETIKDEPEFQFTNRGKILTKGKGEIEMYFVEWKK